MLDLILSGRRRCTHCSNGKIDVDEQLVLYNTPFQNPQSPFFHLTRMDYVLRSSLKDDIKNFCQFAYEYNRLFQFASAKLNFGHDVPRRDAYSVIKINNTIHFRQSSYVPPAERGKAAQYAQIFTLRCVL